MGENVKRRAKRREVKARVLHHVLTSDYCVAKLAEIYVRTHGHALSLKRAMRSLHEAGAVDIKGCIHLSRK